MGRMPQKMSVMHWQLFSRRCPVLDLPVMFLLNETAILEIRYEMMF